MKVLKIGILMLMAMAISFSTFAKKDVEKTKTAEEVWANVATLNQFDEDFVKAEIKSLPAPEKVKLLKKAVNEAKMARETGEVANVVYYILAIFIPPLAVALSNGLGTEFWIDLLLTILGWLPGIIYAFIVL